MGTGQSEGEWRGSFRPDALEQVATFKLRFRRGAFIRWVPSTGRWEYRNTNVRIMGQHLLRDVTGD
jgi:hypothetical protein